MKAISSLFLAVTAMAALAQAAPRLVVSTPSLVPESKIDLVFDLAVVSPESIGTTTENRLAAIQPALPGKLLWKAHNIAELQLESPPAMNTTYVFSIRGGMKHLDGSAIPEGVISRIASESFRPLGCQATGNRWSDEYSLSTASWVMHFNDAVDPAAFAKRIQFVNHQGLAHPARVEPVTYETMGYSGSKIRPWDARGRNQESLPSPVGDDTAPHAVMITPATPLPPAQKWQIILPKGSPNRSASARTTEDFLQNIGDIAPFRVNSMRAVTEVDCPRAIQIDFNSPLPEKLPDTLFSNLLTIHPRPEQLSAEADGKTLRITGSLDAADQYSVSIRAPFSSRSGHALENTRTEDLRFEHLEPELSLPSNHEAQYAKGSRSYSFRTVNVSSAHIRIKQLTGGGLIRTFQGYQNYTGSGYNGENISPTAPLPWSMVDGPQIAQRDFQPSNQQIDTSSETTFAWDEILDGKTTGVFFLDATGQPHAKSPTGTQRRNAQAIIQLTDIGLAWKTTPKETFVQAFSCDSGKPLAQVSLELFGEDAQPLHSATTDAAGLARMPRDAKVRHLLARLGEDLFVTAFDDTLSTVGLWHFPVRTSWLKPGEVSRRAFLFTDRPLYRPGETIRLKGIIRNLRGNTLEAAGSSPARLVILDPTEKEIRTEPVTVSPNGSFDFTHQLAPETVGNHTIRLEFPDELAQIPPDEDDYRNWQENERIRENAIFTTTVQVEEFRRNAFEIIQKLDPPTPGARSLAGSLTAKYYQGPPVASGQAKQYARVTTTNLYPERFRDFLFGNHRSYDWNYWYHYFGYRGDSEDPQTEPFQHHGEFQLTADGNASFEIPLPESNFPTRRQIRVSTEVTDARLQTLTSVTTATVDPASVYVGVSRIDRLVRAGDEVPLRIVAVDPQGNPFTQPLQINASLTREVNEATKVVGEDGATTTRNNQREESISTSQFPLDPAASQAEGQLFLFRPTAAGLHFLTLHGTDPEGRPFSTVTRFHVYGTKDYPWLYEDGLRIKLIAEKTKYQPGETARVLVLSPIEGTALVTIEREKVLRSFQTELRGDNPVVEIPLDDLDSPNVFVSVLVIKGAAESAREHKEPQLRLGYCELIVENLRDRLAVTLDEPESSYRPGEEITLGGKITSADGQPAADAEVTFFAEDEGTLAVTGYDTPDPMAFFYKPRLLQVDSGTSFHTFLSENPDYRGYFNKGFFVGGGGGIALSDEQLRKNFDPCAAWAPALVTGPDGTFRHTFRLPDTLTRYRIVAVAHQGTTRFGHVESSIIVKKELMLEPKSPRFAHQGDEIVNRLLVQNTSLHAGTWSIGFQAHAATGEPVCISSGTPATTVSLAAGASTTLEFPIRAQSIGEAVLAWKAVPVSLERQALSPALTQRLSDSVESRFPVQHPMPRLRQTKLMRLGTDPTQLLAPFDEPMRHGSGSVSLEFAFSPLLEAAGSIDYLLTYPHGCLEQTSSSLIPWCSVDALRPIVPAFAKIPPEKIRDALQGGVNRLLTMQLQDGSFSYWPGQSDTVDWATPYAAMVMLIAADRGAHIPESARESLCQALITSLRGMAETKSPSALETHARSLYALALAGKPQFPYQNALAERSTELTPTTRALLAAAIARSSPGGDHTAARALLTAKPSRTQSDSWMPHHPVHALTLLAWTEIDPTASECHKILDQLLRDRNPYGHWGSTWNNGWTLVALAAYAKHNPIEDQSSTIQLSGDAGQETIELGHQLATAQRDFALSPGMKLAATAAPTAFLRATISAYPPVATIQPVSSNGMSIDRIHQRVLPNGGVEPLDQPRPGDLILVTLRVTMPHDNTHYLVVEDPLPSIFETVSSDFSTQKSALNIPTSQNNWQVSHSELRDDRAVFYLDRVWHRGTYTLSYLARCTLPGDVYAPPAKVETMYDPEKTALSASREFKTQ